MYEQVFQFSSRPFTTTPFVKHYFAGSAIHQALGQARLCIDRASGPVVMIGDIGTGKSLALAMLEDQYKLQFTVVNLGCARLESRKDLLQSVLFAIDRPVVGMTEAELRFDLMAQVKPNPNCPNGMLLLVDDAENLAVDLIDELRLITNYIVDGQPRVRLVMAGRNQLDETLNDPQLASFAQRIASRCYLKPLTREETAAYVQEHIQRVGGNGDQLFPPATIAKLQEHTDGVPRLINQVCDFALICTGTQGKQVVTPECITDAWADVQSLPGIVPGQLVPSQPPSDDWTVIEFGQLDDDHESGDLIELTAEPAEPAPAAPTTAEQSSAREIESELDVDTTALSMTDESPTAAQSESIAAQYDDTELPANEDGERSVDQPIPAFSAKELAAAFGESFPMYGQEHSTAEASADADSDSPDQKSSPAETPVEFISDKLWNLESNEAGDSEENIAGSQQTAETVPGSQSNEEKIWSPLLRSTGAEGPEADPDEDAIESATWPASSSLASTSDTSEEPLPTVGFKDTPTQDQEQTAPPAQPITNTPAAEEHFQPEFKLPESIANNTTSPEPEPLASAEIPEIGGLSESQEPIVEPSFVGFSEGPEFSLPNNEELEASDETTDEMEVSGIEPLESPASAAPPEESWVDSAPPIGDPAAHVAEQPGSHGFIDPFAETFEQEETLRDRFTPIIAAQNQSSLQITSEDLSFVKPLDEQPSAPEFAEATVPEQPTDQSEGHDDSSQPGDLAAQHDAPSAWIDSNEDDSDSPEAAELQPQAVENDHEEIFSQFDSETTELETEWSPTLETVVVDTSDSTDGPDTVEMQLDESLICELEGHNSDQPEAEQADEVAATETVENEPDAEPQESPAAAVQRTPTETDSQDSPASAPPTHAAVIRPMGFDSSSFGSSDVVFSARGVDSFESALTFLPTPSIDKPTTEKLAEPSLTPTGITPTQESSSTADRWDDDHNEPKTATPAVQNESISPTLEATRQPIDQSDNSPQPASYHEHSNEQVDEEISRQADAILERLTRARSVSHGTDVNSDFENSENAISDDSEQTLDASKDILDEIREQREQLTSSFAQTQANFASAPEPTAAAPEHELLPDRVSKAENAAEDSSEHIPLEYPLRSEQDAQQVHQDDSEMIIVNRMNQQESPKEDKQNSIPLPSTPISTGRAQRMDYQQLFDQLRNPQSNDQG